MVLEERGGGMESGVRGVGDGAGGVSCIEGGGGRGSCGVFGGQDEPLGIIIGTHLVIAKEGYDAA